MAVLSVKERHQGRRSSIRDGRLVHVREWIVTCDSAADGTAVALTADDGTRRIPIYGSVHPKDGGAVLTGIEADPHQESDRIFLVRGEYTSAGFSTLPTNPIERPFDISYGAREWSDPYFIDESDPAKHVVNSAGDPPESFLERDEGCLIINISSNEGSFNPVLMEEFRHSTNLATVHIDGIDYEEGTLLLLPPTAAKIIETVEGDGDLGLTQTFKYYRCQWTLVARADGHNDTILDIGRNEWIPDDDPTKPGKLKPIVDAAGLVVKHPWPLDGNGRKKPNATDKPAELTFQPYDSRDWSIFRWTRSENWPL